MPDDSRKHDGRKLIINEKLVKHIEDLLMSGNTQRAACGIAGISEATFYQWLQVSEALVMGEEHPDMPKAPRRRKGDSDAIFELRKKEFALQIKLLTEFSETVKKAHLTLEAGMVNTVVEAAMPKHDAEGKLIRDGDWKAAMTFLERRNPQEWARRTVGNNPDGSFTVNLRVVNEDGTHGE